MFPEARGTTFSRENLQPFLEYWFLCAMFNRFSSGKRYPALSMRADEKLFEIDNVTFHKWALWQQLHDSFDGGMVPWARLMKPMGISRQRAEVLLSPHHHSLVQTLRKAFTAMGYDQPCAHCYNSMMVEVPVVTTTRSRSKRACLE
jgi:hypothetical protein